MDKSTRMSKIKARLNATQDIMKKAEGAMLNAEKVRDERFGDAEMLQNAREAAEGLNLASLDELRSMKMQPPPLVEIVARCVCTLASGDDLGDAEYRAKEKAREAAAKKAVEIAKAKGLPPPKTRETIRRRLLTWEEAQRVLARANFKDKIAHFDGRQLLENDDLVAEVANRIDLTTIRPEATMAENLKPPVRTQRERNVEASNAQRRREGYAEAIAKGDATSAPQVTIDDARYVSRIAPPLLVWVARILAQHKVHEPAWKQVQQQVKEAKKKVDEAKEQVAAMKRKADEAREDEAHKKLKLKEEKERMEALGLQMAEEEEKAKRHATKDDRATELTKPGQLVISGPTPNIFFQNGRVSSIAGPGSDGGSLSPRLQLPSTIRFFIRVKHCRVSWPFPPSISPDKYLLTAQVMEGHEAAGPVAHVQFDPGHVIGLSEHQLLSFVQLVIEVPSMGPINPNVHPTRLCFHPRHGSQLHSCGAGGAGTLELPRLIVTVYPLLISRAVGRAGNSAPSSRASSPDRMALSPLGRPSQPRASVTTGSPDAAVPPLPIKFVHTIGSAYRSAVTQHRGGDGQKGKQLFGDNDCWPRAAVALTERARTRPFALSKPGVTRQIPDILLQNAVVSISSARRLSRSSARLGVAALKDLSALVLRHCEGYVLTASEKRQLRKAAELEAEVEREDQKAEAAAAQQEGATGESASATAAATKEAELLKVKTEAEETERKAKAELEELDKAATKDKVVTAKMVAEAKTKAVEEQRKQLLAREQEEREDREAKEAAEATEAAEALAQAEAAARAANLPGAEEFGQLFGGSDEVALAATVAAHAVMAGTPAAAAAAADAFAAAVQSCAPALEPATASSKASASNPASPRRSKGEMAKGDKSPAKSPRAKALAPAPAGKATAEKAPAASPEKARRASAGAAAPSKTAAKAQPLKGVPPLTIPSPAEPSVPPT